MNQIKRARINAGLSQKQVAISLQVSIPTVSEWESGKKTPRADNLERLAALFHVSVDYLLGREEAKKEPITTSDDGLDEELRNFIEKLKGLDEETLLAIEKLVDSIISQRGQ